MVEKNSLFLFIYTGMPRLWLVLCLLFAEKVLRHISKTKQKTLMIKLFYLKFDIKTLIQQGCIKPFIMYIYIK